MNSPILTEYGNWDFVGCDLSVAQIFLKKQDVFVSAIGHQATAELLSSILGMNIPMNRIQVKMKSGDKALVFRLIERIPEGKVLTAEELRTLKYEFGVLTLN